MTRLLLLTALVDGVLGIPAGRPVVGTGAMPVRSPVEAYAVQAPTPRRSPLELAHDLPRLRAWIDAVDRHLPGQTDAAASAVASWSKGQLEVLLLDVTSLLRLLATPDKPRFPRALRAFTVPELEALQELAAQEARHVVERPVAFQPAADTPLVNWRLSAADTRRAVNRLVKRAALLHTDIALLLPAAADRAAELVPVPRPRLPTRSSVQIEDGRQVGVSYYGAHWDVARLLLDEVTPGPGADDTVRQWYRIIAALFSSRLMHAESLVHVTRAQQLFPADAQILAASGRLHETFAAPVIQQFLAGTSGANGDASRALMGSSRSNLRQAETLFSKAVELDDRFAAARLHLGRVLGLQGHHEDAASQLRQAADTADDPLTQYYSWLFLGVEEQALARPDRARESFDTAARLSPRAQSPQLALGQLARRQGDRPGALAALQKVLALSAVDRVSEDPWSTYLTGGIAEAQARLSELRALLFLTPGER
jgi:hypothetical protein